MMYGIGETLAERIEHLERVREVDRADSRLHLLAVVARENADDTPASKDRRGRFTRHRPHRARQRPEPPGGWPMGMKTDDRPAFQRLWLAHDRGERRPAANTTCTTTEEMGAHLRPGSRSRRRQDYTILPTEATGAARERDASVAPRVGVGYDSPLARRDPHPWRRSIPSDVHLEGPRRHTRRAIGARSSAPRWNIGRVDRDPANKDGIDGHAAAVERIRSLGWSVHQVDVAIVAEKPKIASHRELMRDRLASALGVGASQVSVKGKTNEGMGWIGRGEGIACIAVATLVPVAS
jgi:hypothetical protein